MKNTDKYKPQYFPLLGWQPEWIHKERITHAPTWCSVDLRDGNQSLVIPMTLDEKLEFFMTLVKIGFKQIEIGFPAASETEFEFCRKLIEDNLIPDDVTIQVLTQARESIIKRTFEAIHGVRRAIVSMYNSISLAQREQVFKKNKEQIKEIAVNGARIIKECAEKEAGSISFLYSPESFTGTEPEYALEVCNAVLDVWQPTKNHKAIINIPATVELCLPHIYANQIEYLNKNLKYRDSIVLSLHPHNDRGTGVALAEFGLLAGAERIEGTLFGNGERTGNVDVVTLALNMYSHGVNPSLDFSNIRDIVKVYEKTTHMRVHERAPYAGTLVFCAFSGSHQDAITKGMKYRLDNDCKHWTVPYLPLDPSDIGRSYESDVIRINSQSGKGAVGYILERSGYNLPPKMREAVSYSMKHASCKHNKELSPKEVAERFIEKFVDLKSPIKFKKCSFTNGGTTYTAHLEIKYNNQSITLVSQGNGRLDAVANALAERFSVTYDDLAYSEHTLGTDSDARACTYIGLLVDDIYFWGVGIDNDIMTSSIKALVSAVNKTMKKRNNPQNS